MCLWKIGGGLDECVGDCVGVMLMCVGDVVGEGVGRFGGGWVCLWLFVT